MLQTLRFYLQNDIYFIKLNILVRRISSSAGSEKMERDSDRQKEMEGHLSTGQGSQRAVVPMEEEEIF
jgi:hypothetical protein